MPLCWIHHVQGRLTQLLCPGLEPVSLGCQLWSCVQSLDFSSLVESCLLPSGSCILAGSWVISESLPFSACSSRGGCLFFSSHPDAIYMWLMFPCPLWVSPAPCMGTGHPGSPSVPLMWFVSIKMGSHFLQRPFYLVHFRDLEGWRYLIILWQLILAIYKIPLNFFHWFIIK